MLVLNDMMIVNIQYTIIHYMIGAGVLKSQSGLARMLFTNIFAQSNALIM